MEAGMRVLVVDDDSNILDFMDLALSDQGCEVVTAEHGVAALAAANEADPDLILLDMRMPVMDGWEFSRRYRTMPGPRAPIIVLTAANDAAEAAREIGADGFLGKPFDLGELVALVKSHSRRD